MSKGKESKNIDLRKGMQMMKQLANRGEKTEVMTEELFELEKKLETLKHVYVTSSKKIAGSLQSSSGESDDKRRKKIAEYTLANTFRDLAQTVPPDTATFAVLNKCSDVFLAVTDDFIRYQKAVEVVLSDLNALVDVSISDLEKKKKDVKDLGSKMDAAKNRYNILLTKAQQASQQVTSYSNPSVSGWNVQQSADGITSLSGGLDGSVSAAAFGEDVRDAQHEASEAEEKMERYREDLKVSMRKFCKSEAEHSSMLVQLLSAQLELHRSCFERLEAVIPLCTRTIQELTPRPVFGIPLDEHLKQTGRRIAVVLEEGSQLLIKRGLEEEGLFRLAASQQKLKRLKIFYDFGKSLEQERTFEEDVHVIAGVVKQYLRELPEPLLGFAQYDDWVRGASYEDRERIALYRNCVRKLPVSNRENLDRLIQLLKQVVQHCDRNKMNEQNVGICIGPNLLWSESSRNGGESDAGIMIQVCPIIVGTFIQFYDRIFDQSAEQVRPAPTDDSAPDTAHSLATEMKRAGSVSGSQPPRIAPQRRPPPPPVKPAPTTVELQSDLDRYFPQAADSTPSGLLIDLESSQITTATVHQPVLPISAIPAALQAGSRLARSASSASTFGSQPGGPRLPAPARPPIEPPRQAPPPPPPPQPPTPSYMYAYQQNSDAEGVQQPAMQTQTQTPTDGSHEYVNVASLSARSDASSIYPAEVIAESTGSPSRQRNPPAPPVRRPSQTHKRTPSSELLDRPSSPTQALAQTQTQAQAGFNVPTAGAGSNAKPEAPVKPAPPAPPARTYGASAPPYRRN